MLALQKLNQAREALNEAAAELERIVTTLGLPSSQRPLTTARLVTSRPAAEGLRRFHIPVTTTKIGGKRDPQTIEATTARLLEHIKANKGQRIEQIAKALNVSTKDLRLPTVRLLSEKRIMSRGNRRATQYYARG